MWGQAVLRIFTGDPVAASLYCITVRVLNSREQTHIWISPRAVWTYKVIADESILQWWVYAIMKPSSSTEKKLSACVFMLCLTSTHIKILFYAVIDWFLCMLINAVFKPPSLPLQWTRAISILKRRRNNPLLVYTWRECYRIYPFIRCVCNCHCTIY